MVTQPPKRMRNKQVVAAYPYHNQQGQLLFYKLRTDPKDFGYWTPNAPREEAWHKPTGADAFLYRMVELENATRYGDDVWWCAGEKDADRVQQELTGRDTATTMHGGEGKPLKAGQAEWFRGFIGMIYVVGDLDVAGYKDMVHKYNALLDVGVDGSQIQLRLPRTTEEGSDVYDHLEAGLKLGQLRKVKIDTLHKKLEEAGEQAQQDKADRKAQTKGQARLEAFQAALREHGSEPNGKEDWHCPHPEHEDERQSFGVTVGETGNLVLKCHGCESAGRDENRNDWIDEILEALDLDWSAIQDVVARLQIPGNDTEAAEWLLARHGEDIRWLDVGTAARSQWIAWDGARWRPDADGLVRRWMHELSKEMIPIAEAEYKRTRGVKGAMKESSDLLARAKALGNKVRIDAALSVAQTLRPAMTVQRSIFDRDKNALAVGNGVLLLESQARLVPSDRSHLMLRNTEVPYLAGAASAAWEDFLDTFVQDEKMEDFLARMAGYTLLGSNPDGLMFLFQGEPNTGKSTFTNAISRALGDYAKPFELGALRGKMSADAPREDIAAIMHARLAHAAEMTGAWMLHADQIKRLTGSDEIPYRKLWEQQTSHTPDFTPWISSNFPPRIKGADRALQVRLVGIPFLHAVDRKSDAARALYTPDALASVLAWVVAGYNRYKEVGLDRGTWPLEVELATDELRTSLDNEDDFITDMYEVENSSWAPAGPLMYDLYTQWCFTNGVREPMTSQQFGQALTAKGFRRVRKRVDGDLIDVRLGLKLKAGSTVKGAN